MQIWLVDLDPDLPGNPAIQHISGIAHSYDHIRFFRHIAKHADPGSHIDASFDGADIVVAIHGAMHSLTYIGQGDTISPLAGALLAVAKEMPSPMVESDAITPI